MADYYWKGGTDTESQTAGNWVTTSGGSTQHTTLPDGDDNLFFDVTATKKCVFTSDTVAYLSITIKSTFTFTVKIDNSLVSTQGLCVEKISVLESATASIFRFHSTPAYRGLGSSSDDNYVKISNVDTNLDFNTLGMFKDSTSRANFTFYYEPTNITFILQNGVYPNVTMNANISTGTFSPQFMYDVEETTGLAEDYNYNNYPSVDILNLNIDDSITVSPRTKNLKDSEKIYKVTGSLTLTTSTFKWGYTELQLTPSAAGTKLPVTGETTYGNTNTFNTQYRKLKILSSSTAANYFALGDNLILGCEELEIEGNARLYGPVYGNGNSAEIHITNRPTIDGDWNFTQIAEGIYRNNGTTSPRYSVPHGGTGKNSITSKALLYGNGQGPLTELAIGSEGTVLTVSSGTPVWAANTGGDGGGGGTLDIGDLVVTNNDSGIIIMGSLVI
jgi:hypothetical protein